MTINKAYQICSRCIMDTSDPGIIFDSNGVCNHCHDFDKNIKKNWFPNEFGEKKIEDIVKKIKIENSNKDYDCVVGLSGGVDSSYVAYLAKKKYDLRVLAVHVDGGWNSELAVKNIENIVKKLNIDLYTHVVNWEEMKDLQRSFLLSGIDEQDIPQDHAFFAALYAFAVKNKIKYIISGGNIATESILPSSWGYNAMDLRFIKSIHKKYGTIKLRTFPTVNFFKYYIYYPYIKKMTVIRPLNFMEYNKNKAIEILKNELDWKNYGGKHHESRFTKFFQGYYLPKRFGYDKNIAHLSSMILSGLINRGGALLEKENSRCLEKQQLEDIIFVLKKLDLSMEDFDQIMKMPLKTFKDYPSNYTLFKLKDKIKGVLNSIGIYPRSK